MYVLYLHTWKREEGERGGEIEGDGWEEEEEEEGSWLDPVWIGMGMEMEIGIRYLLACLRVRFDSLLLRW